MSATSAKIRKRLRASSKDTEVGLLSFFGVFSLRKLTTFDAYSLATLSGTAFEINKENWILGDFLKAHALQPSKVRFYILFKM